MLESSREYRNFDSLWENQNLEALILKEAHDRIVGSYLDSLILLRLRSKQLSGYDLLKIIQADFNLLISPGTMYSTLYSLERQGLIECSTSSRKRLYQLTNKGKTTIHTVSKSKNLRQVLFSIAREIFSEQL